jgi:hypothetical protein
MDVMGRVHLTGGLEVKVVTGIDDHSRFIVCARVVVRATARPVCQALAAALGRHGIPAQILTDNGKVFTARFGRGPGPVMFDRICVDNGIAHLLTAPYSPTTTGKVDRLHKTMRAEFFTPGDGLFRHRRTAAGSPRHLGRGLQHHPAAPIVRRAPADRTVPPRRSLHHPPLITPDVWLIIIVIPTATGVVLFGRNDNRMGAVHPRNVPRVEIDGRQRSFWTGIPGFRTSSAPAHLRVDRSLQHCG